MNCNNKDWDSDVNISREMGLQKIAENDIESYRKQLHDLRVDINSEVGRVYRRLVTNTAKQMEMKLPNTDITVFDYKHVGEDFRINPTWVSAELLYHSVYTSVDNLPNFLLDMEKHIMNIKNLRYSDETDAVKIMRQTGIRSCIVSKINAIRKDLNKRVSGKHGFRIVKSLQKLSSGKQAPRRKKGVFNIDFVKNKDPKKKTFEEYLKTIQGKNYIEWKENDKYSSMLDEAIGFEKIEVQNTVVRKLDYSVPVTVTNKEVTPVEPLLSSNDNNFDFEDLAVRKTTLLATLKSLEDLEERIKEKEQNCSERLKEQNKNQVTANTNNNKKNTTDDHANIKNKVMKPKRGRKVRINDCNYFFLLRII